MSKGPTRNELLNTAQYINQDSGNVERYTPAWIIERVTRMFGGAIELDPASSEAANRLIQARRYFDQEDDGLRQVWKADNVWLNHPYGRSTNLKWVFKATDEYKNGNAKQICMITYGSTSERWFQLLAMYPQCLLSKRVSFLDSTTLQPLKGNTKGSVITYMGPHIGLFYETFREYGKVMIPYTLGRHVQNMQEYQVAAGKYTNFRLTREERIMQCLLGLGESGEVQNAYKKMRFDGHGDKHDHMIEELGDLLWYMTELADALGTTLKEIATRNLEKLRRRYPNGYSAEASMARLDKSTEICPACGANLADCIC